MSEPAVNTQDYGRRPTQGLISGSFFSALGMAAGGCLTVLSGAVFARWLQPDGFGAYSLALVVIAFAGGLGAFGMENTVPRFCAMYLGNGRTERIRPLLRFALKYSIVTSLVLGAVLWTLLRFDVLVVHRLRLLREIAVWVAVGVPLVALQMVFLQTILGLQSITARIVLEKILQPLLRFLLPFLLVCWLGERLQAAVGGVVITAALLAMLASAFVNRRIRGMAVGAMIGNDLRHEWLVYALPFVFYSLQNFVSAGMGIEMLLVAWLASLRESGIYAAAFRVTSVLALARGAVDYAFGPKVGILFGRSDLTSIATLYKSSGTIALAWTVPFAVVLGVFSRPLMIAFFGAGYDAGAPALTILVVGFVADSATGCNTTLLSMMGRSGLVLLNGLAGGIITVGLCLALLPALGMTGAAVAVSVARILLNLLATAEIWHLQRMHPFSRSTAKICLAALLAAPLGALCWRQLAFDNAIGSLSVSIVLVVASYFALLRITRVSWGLA